MSLEETILEKLRSLTPEKQQEVLNFADSLQPRQTSKPPRRDMYGLCADLSISLSEEDIAEARREMWGRFPRPFPPVES